MKGLIVVKSPAGYRTGHFPEIRPDTGPDMLSGTPLVSVEYKGLIISRRFSREELTIVMAFRQCFFSIHLKWPK